MKKLSMVKKNMTAAGNYLLLLVLCLVFTMQPGCASGKIVTSPPPPPGREKTDECLYQEEICAEAQDFQKVYDRLPEDEQKDMNSVLNTYIIHCKKATQNCDKSMDIKR